jgi:hypothetical protein
MTCASPLPISPIGIACAVGVPTIKPRPQAKAPAAIQFFNMTVLHSFDLARGRPRRDLGKENVAVRMNRRRMNGSA